MAQRFFSDIQLDSKFTVGVDDTGHDVKFFGATAGSFMLWDESADALLLTDSTPLNIVDGSDLQIKHNGSDSLFNNNTGDIYITNKANNKDIILQSDDGSGGVQTYLTIDGGDETIISSVPFVLPTRKFTFPSSTVGEYSGGDIYYYGSGSTVKGSIYFMASGGGWTLADADAESTASGLLAVALGTDPDVDGMLLRGFVTLLTEVEGTEAIGSTLYLSATDTGIATTAIPSGNGDIVRVLGYSLHATDNQVYFNPAGTFVEVSA